MRGAERRGGEEGNVERRVRECREGNVERRVRECREGSVERRVRECREGSVERRVRECRERSVGRGVCREDEVNKMTHMLFSEHVHSSDQDRLLPLSPSPHWWALQVLPCGLSELCI